ASGGEAATFFGVPEDDFTLISGEPKAFHYIAQSGKGLDRNFCPNCGARVFTTNLESFPGTVFVTIGSLDNPKAIKPVLGRLFDHLISNGVASGGMCSRTNSGSTLRIRQPHAENQNR